ncbi:MAG: hypothetical protein J6C91_10885 [Muribaculaceae bacterium]|nr:hypothetical protein [Muribaculaceae bacterium]
MCPEELQKGDIIEVRLSQYDGIHPKGGFSDRRKYFVVLGICNGYAMLGGIVVNSTINSKLSWRITDFQIAISAAEYPFLEHDSYFDCSKLIKPRFATLTNAEMKGKASAAHFAEIINKVRNNPTIPRIELQMFSI